jgi:hypothetical protein
MDRKPDALIDLRDAWNESSQWSILYRNQSVIRNAVPMNVPLLAANQAALKTVSAPRVLK